MGKNKKRIYPVRGKKNILEGMALGNEQCHTNARLVVDGLALSLSIKLSETSRTNLLNIAVEAFKTEMHFNRLYDAGTYPKVSEIIKRAFEKLPKINEESFGRENIQEVKDVPLSSVISPTTVAVVQENRNSSYRSLHIERIETTILANPDTTAYPPKILIKEAKGSWRATRDGQNDFRKAVGDNFNWCCCVTGESIRVMLEAAHISPHADGEDYNLNNGLLMTASLHRLFDAGLMAINPQTMTVHFKCDWLDRDLYEGTAIFKSHSSVSSIKLKERWEMFTSMQ